MTSAYGAFDAAMDGSSGQFLHIPLYLVDFLDGNINAALFLQRLHYLSRFNHDKKLGVYKSREEWYADTRLTPRQIDTVRKYLTEKGYVTETKVRSLHRTYYKANNAALNKDFAKWRKAYFSKVETDFKEQGNDMVSHLRIPKKDKRVAEDAQKIGTNKNATGSNKSASGSNKSATRIYITKTQKEDTELNVRSRSLPRSFDSISSAIDEVKKRGTRKREEKASTAKQTGVRRHAQKTIQAAWQEVMAEHHPGIYVVPASPAELVKLQSALSGVLATSSLHEVFSFFAEYWTTLRATKFKWLAEKGQTLSNAPSLSELLRYWRVFAKAFADRQAIKTEQAAKAVVTDEAKLREDNRKLAAEIARKETENAQLRKQLRVSNQIASGLSRKREEPQRQPKKTLAERRAALSEELPDNDIPNWKDGK